MKGTNIFIGEKDLKDTGTSVISSNELTRETWVLARPVGYLSFWFTLKCALKVLTHDADIVIWKDPSNN